MKLLQVPTAQLEERIKEEMEENPALEQSEEGFEDEFELKDEFADAPNEEAEPDGSEDEYENIDISEYVQDGDDEIGDYKMRDENYPELDDSKVIPHKVETGINELMRQQLGRLNLDNQQRQIAEQISGSVDDDGSLRPDTAYICNDRAFGPTIDTK